MSETHSHVVHGAGSHLDLRIKLLEKGIQRWRCLTAVGFLTALGAFSIAVFGLSQLENTYFIGEIVATMESGPPTAEGGNQTLQAAPADGVVFTVGDAEEKRARPVEETP